MHYLTSGFKLLVIAFVVVSLSACATSRLSKAEKEKLSELYSLGVKPGDVREKSPLLAGAINFFPAGVGNFYLSSGTPESARQKAAGTANLYTFYISWLWGVPEAVIAAKNINKKATIYYYHYSPEGRKKLAQLQAASE